MSESFSIKALEIKCANFIDQPLSKIAQWWSTSFFYDILFYPFVVWTPTFPLYPALIWPLQKIRINIPMFGFQLLSLSLFFFQPLHKSLSTD